jgi:hypothetical protein
LEIAIENVQLGGPNNKKFMRKNFRDLLLEIHRLPFIEQKEKLNATIENWRQWPNSPYPMEQMDDILIIGFKK